MKYVDVLLANAVRPIVFFDGLSLGGLLAVLQNRNFVIKHRQKSHHQLPRNAAKWKRTE